MQRYTRFLLYWVGLQVVERAWKQVQVLAKQPVEHLENIQPNQNLNMCSYQCLELGTAPLMGLGQAQAVLDGATVRVYPAP